MLCTLSEHGLEAEFMNHLADAVRIDELSVPESSRSYSEMALDGLFVFVDLEFELRGRSQ